MSTDVFTVAREEYTAPCDHPLCDRLHKNRPVGHETTRRFWVVLRDGERDGDFDVFDRKSDAEQAIERALGQVVVTVTCPREDGTSATAVGRGRYLHEAFSAVLKTPLLTSFGPRSMRERITILSLLGSHSQAMLGTMKFTARGVTR